MEKPIKPHQETLNKIRETLIKEVEGAREIDIIKETNLSKKTVERTLKYMKSKDEIWKSGEDKRWRIEDEGMAKHKEEMIETDPWTKSRRKASKKKILVQTDGKTTGPQYIGENLSHKEKFDKFNELRLTATTMAGVELADENHERKEASEGFKRMLGSAVSDYAKEVDAPEGAVILRWKRIPTNSNCNDKPANSRK